MIIECRTDEGGRAYQQDAYGWVRLAGPDGRERACCVLADGMGGVKGGGIASRLAVSAILTSLYPRLLLDSQTNWRDPAFHECAIGSAFDDSRALLSQAANGSPMLTEMGTTVALTIHVGTTVIVAHCGDTRVYALDDTLELVTADHSVAWGLVESEVVNASEVRHVGTRSMLTRSLTVTGGEFDLQVLNGATAAVYALATDGLWELFDIPDLEEFLIPLKDQEDTDSIADALMAEAQARGPDDNLTFLLFIPARRTRPATDRYPCLSRTPFFTPVDTEEETNGT